MDKIRIMIADDIEETREVIKKILNLDKDTKGKARCSIDRYKYACAKRVRGYRENHK